MFSPASSVATGRYPQLAASVSVNYGTVNPRPNPAGVQANATPLGSGPLFGESVSAGNADGSLFQPNTSPDVVTIAVKLDKGYFTKLDSLYVPDGTLMLVAKQAKADTRSHLNRSRDLGVTHTGILSYIKPGIVATTLEQTLDKIAKLRCFPTVCVGPTTFFKNKVTYVAVAIQNVTRVSTIGTTGVSVIQDDPQLGQPGTLFYIGYESGYAVLVTQKPSIACARRVRVVVPVSHHERVALADVGTIECCLPDAVDTRDGGRRGHQRRCRLLGLLALR